MTHSMRPMPYRRLNTRARLMTVAVLSCYASTPVWGQTTVTAADLQKTNIGNFNAVQGNRQVDVYNLANRTVATSASFHVLAGETFNIHQNSASDAFMVRVTGQSGQLQQSVIAGKIWSNGQFWLQNAAGTIIKPGAVIDVSRFVAALGITDANFLAGKLTFDNPVNGGKIVNQGTIKTASGGSVYLVGTDVSNEGVIQTPQGEAILAAGEKVELIDTGTPGVKVQITGQAGNVTNLGQILADAGRIGMVGAVVRNSGLLNVSASNVVSEGGRVFLKASQDTYVDNKGRIVATGRKGGKVEVLGNRVAVMGEAEIDASGANGGGTILVGGDYQGKNSEVQNAQITYFGPDAKLKADATDQGDGGKIILWGDDTTRAFGRISARGAGGGKGGFVETSAHRLNVEGIRVDLAGAGGANGLWLLDPTDITIVHGAAGAFTGGVFDLTGVSNSVGDTTINNALLTTNVSIQTASAYGGTGNIVINGTADGGGAVQIVNAAATGRTLTLTADANIDMHAGASISGDTGGNALGVTFNAAGGVKLNSGATIKTYGGNVAMTGTGTSSYKSGVQIDGASVDAGGGSITLNGTGYAGGSVNVGVLVTGGASVETSGTGNIQMTGVGGAGSDNDHGVLINGSGASTSRVLAQNGNITLTGTAGDSSTTSMGVGIGGFDSYVEVSGTGNVVVDAITPSGGQGGDFTLYSSGTNGIRTNSGNITIKANNATLTSGMISAGSGTVTIAPHTASAQIQLGTGATQAANVLALTSASLARFSTSGQMVIGSATTGDVTVVGNLGLSSLPNGGLAIATGSDINVNAALGGSTVSVTHTGSSGNWTSNYSGAYNSDKELKLLAGNAVNVNAWTGNAGTGAMTVMAGWNTASGTSAPTLATSLTAGKSININSGGGIASNGAVTLTAVDEIKITAGAQGAGIDMNAAQLTLLANKITLAGGTGANQANAFIRSNGSQTFTVGTFNSSGGLYLQGGSGAWYGGNAEIEANGTSGSQSFVVQNGATVELKGGSATGTTTDYTGDCSVAPGCTNAGARIRNRGSGGQSFTFAAGGEINIYGGSGGNSNGAGIQNEGTGTQTISASSGNVDIALYGGTSGGAMVAYGGKMETLDNSADIESKYGTQTISAGILYLYGGSADYGGAYLTAPTQNITAGALTLEGGTGSAPGGYDAYGGQIWYNAAVIGNDVANTINLSVATLTMNGGASNAFGGSAALIGGYRVPTTVTINSSGAVQMNSTHQWGDRIGSIGGYGGSVSISTTSGSISLGKSYIGTGTGSSDSVTINGHGGVTQNALGRIETKTLTATASAALADVYLDGENKASDVSITAPDYISYASVAPTKLSAISSAGGSVAVAVTNPYAYGGTVSLGTLSAANGTVSVTAAQQILDENGSGTANISAQEITLTSTNGTTDSSGIAISADIAMTGGARTVVASVDNTATYGGISIRNGGTTAPLSVTMTDQSQTSGHAELVYVSSQAIDMTLGAYTLNSVRGGITFGTTGNLTLGSLGTFLPGTGDSSYRYIRMSGQNIATGAIVAPGNAADLYINANGTLNVGHDIGSVRTVGLNAVGGLTMSNAAVSASADAYLGGVNKYGGGAITLTGSSVTAGNAIYAYTGGDIRLNQGSFLAAGQDVNLGLGGTNSTIYLNDTTGYSASYIQAGAGRSTYAAFPSRTSDGIVIDGTSTTASAANGSGFFVGSQSTPATEGNGFNAIYGVAAAAAVTTAVNTVINTINTATTAAQSSVAVTTAPQVTNIPPPTTSPGGSGGIAALGSGTVGGGTGQFGGDAGGTTTGAGGSGTGASSMSGSTGAGSGDSSGAGETSSTESSSGGTSASGGSGGKSGDEKSADNGKQEDKKDDKKDDKSAESGDKKDGKGSDKKPVGKCNA